MPCLSKLCCSAEIFFRDWLCLKKFVWCGIHGNEEADELAEAGSSFVFEGPHVSNKEIESGYSNYIVPHAVWKLLVINREYG
jgi:hypothetical protein